MNENRVILLTNVFIIFFLMWVRKTASRPNTNKRALAGSPSVQTLRRQWAHRLFPQPLPVCGQERRPSAQPASVSCRAAFRLLLDPAEKLLTVGGPGEMFPTAFNPRPSLVGRVFLSTSVRICLLSVITKWIFGLQKLKRHFSIYRNVYISVTDPLDTLPLILLENIWCSIKFECSLCVLFQTINRQFSKE